MTNDEATRRRMREYAAVAEEFRVKDPVVPNALIAQFEQKQDGFDYKKLVCLLKELNECYSRSQVYASFALLRAVLDHIPPLLGCTNFDEVTLKYEWGKTNRHFMMRLRNEYKKLADNALHDPISKRESPLTLGQMPPESYLIKLLQECLDCPIEVREKMREELEEERVRQEKNKYPRISFPEESFAWASNYGGFGSGFLVKITLDNYDRPLDFITDFKMEGVSNGVPWEIKHFLIYTNKEPGTGIELEAGKVLEKLFLYIGYGSSVVGEFMPELEDNSVSFSCVCRSKGKISMSIPNSWLKKSS